VNQFLEELKKELKKQNISDAEMNDILSDHEEMLREAMEEGLSEEDIRTKFGDPSKIAEELKASTEASEEHEKVGDYRLYKTFEVPTEDFSMTIEFINEDAEFGLSESGNIEILYQGRPELEKYTFQYENNHLLIHSPRNLRSGFTLFLSKTKSAFKILLPKKKIQTAVFHSVNGDFCIKNLNIGSLALKNTNGDLCIKDIVTENVKLDTVNGDVQLSNLIATELKFSTISGDVALNNVDVSGPFDVNTVSGDFDANQVRCGKCYFHAVSGDFDGKEFYPEEISLQSVSGDISIHNSDASRPIHVAQKKSVSGDINITSK